MPTLKPEHDPLGFVPLEPNKNFEISTHERRDLNKGAFTDEARVALAMAVKDKKPTVKMDKYDMLINYRDDHIYIVADNGAGLPCGVFDYKKLREREV